MSVKLTETQRQARYKAKGEPALRLEFDVFADGSISMWTHFDHAGDFHQVKGYLEAIQKHLDEFLKDERMCPFQGLTTALDLPSSGRGEGIKENNDYGKR